MQFSASTKPIPEISTDLLIMGLFEGQAPGKEISDLLLPGDFTGKLGEVLLIPQARSLAKRIALLGLGKKNEYDLEKLRIAVSTLAPIIQKHKIRHLTFSLIKERSGAVRAIIETLLLSNYKFTEYKKLEEHEAPAPLEHAHFILNTATDRARVLKQAKVGETLAEIVNQSRNLGNHPSNVATPSHLAAHAQSLAAEYKTIKVKILGRREIEKENMGAFLAVAKGSDEEPKFIILEYRAKKSAPRVVLVGKGITFDSGGLSLKPSEKMEEMKYDMMGAASVLGTIKAAAALKLPINLVGLVPATENLPSGKATKPGDIVRARSGKTIEVVNTDAEGRMVLADALDYAKQYKPAVVIDFATLTGAIVVALGDDLIGAFSNNKKYLDKLGQASKITGEKIWPMPLETEYDQFIKSDFADLRNIGTVKFADAINGANFLKNFVDYPWIHLDIAGVAWATREKPYRPKGATGTGIRLAVEFLKNFKKP